MLSALGWKLDLIEVLVLVELLKIVRLYSASRRNIDLWLNVAFKFL